MAQVGTLDYKAFYAGTGTPQEELKKRIAELYEALVPFEVELKRRGTKFFRGVSIYTAIIWLHKKSVNFL